MLLRVVSLFNYQCYVFAVLGVDDGLSGLSWLRRTRGLEQEGRPIYPGVKERRV